MNQSSGKRVRNFHLPYLGISGSLLLLTVIQMLVFMCVCVQLKVSLTDGWTSCSSEMHCHDADTETRNSVDVVFNLMRSADVKTISPGDIEVSFQSGGIVMPLMFACFLFPDFV